MRLDYKAFCAIIDDKISPLVRSQGHACGMAGQNLAHTQDTQRSLLTR